MPTSFLDWLDAAPLSQIGLLLLSLMAVAFFLGRRLHVVAARRSKYNQASGQSYEGYLISSVLGLLAILLGFTFSLAINRFEERRQLVVSQANAIGTAYLRIQLLPSPDRERLSRLIVDYTDSMIAFAAADESQARTLIVKDDTLLREIWAATAAAFDRVRSTSLSLALANAINPMIDLDATRRSSRRIHVPTAVFAVLLFYLISSSGILGYVLAESPGRFGGAFILVMLSLALLLIIDIDRPESGAIREDQFAMLRLRATLESAPLETFDRWRSPPNARPAAAPGR